MSSGRYWDWMGLVWYDTSLYKRHFRGMRIRTSKKHVRVLAALWSEMVSWIKIYIYTGWWFHPSENMSSLVGMMKFPTEWKNKNMFQTTNQYIYIYIYTYIYIYISATPWGIRLIGEPIHNIRVYDLNLGPSQIFFDWTTNLHTIGVWCFDQRVSKLPDPAK